MSTDSTDIVTSFYEGREVWFVTGSQDLYGEETLAQVAEQSQEVVRLLNESDLLSASIVPASTSRRSPSAAT